MKIITTLFAFLIGTLSLNAQDSWFQVDSVNGAPRAAATAFKVGPFAYVATGLEEYGFSRKMHSYDLWQNDWDNETSLGNEIGQGLDRASAISFSSEINQKGYVGLGQTETVAFMNDLWEFDVVTNVWTQKANFIGSPRKQAIAFTLQSTDLAYVGTGQDATGLTKDFYTYNASTNTWTQIQDFPGLARRGAVAYSGDNHGFIGTGDAGILLNDFWMYDATLDTWIQKAPFPGSPRSGAVAWTTDSDIDHPQGYIALGEDNFNEFKKDVWEYNYYTNSWMQRSDFPGVGRKDAVAFSIQGIAYVGTGYNGVFHDDFYAYSGTADVEVKDDLTEFTIFPNPTNSLVEFTGIQEGLIGYRIYAASGDLIFEEMNNPSQLHSINLWEQVRLPGVYLIQLHGKNSTYPLKKIILQ
jgi:N-acetylneuraminic acid mutarotase